MNGILNIYKEPGWTSFDVVAKLRRILKQKKIGHTGTLDPAAEGVLPVCIGKATRLCDLLTGGTKTYEAVLLLGTQTDTLDLEGQVLHTCPVDCTEEAVRECIGSFLGEQEQIPPMYSALKINGKHLYELAREGREVERKARRVTFYALDILKTELPRVRIRVTCSKGTYIRSLCDDIGRKLGCGGCMEKLIRTQSGGFEIADARKISEIEALAAEGRIEEVMIPMDAVFRQYPPVYTTEQGDKAAHNGNAVPAERCVPERSGGTVIEKEPADGQQVRLYDSRKHFIGIYVFFEDGQLYRPRKVLWSNPPESE